MVHEVEWPQASSPSRHTFRATGPSTASMTSRKLTSTGDPGQGVAAVRAPRGADQARVHQGLQDLGQEVLRDVHLPGDLPEGHDRAWATEAGRSWPAGRSRSSWRCGARAAWRCPPRRRSLPRVPERKLPWAPAPDSATLTRPRWSFHGPERLAERRTHRPPLPQPRLGRSVRAGRGGGARRPGRRDRVGPHRPRHRGRHGGRGPRQPAGWASGWSRASSSRPSWSGARSTCWATSWTLCTRASGASRTTWPAAAASACTPSSRSSPPSESAFASPTSRSSATARPSGAPTWPARWWRPARWGA